MDSVEYRIRLVFDGAETIDIGCRPNEDVVSAGLRQGVLIVSDCRRGICGACRAFLAAGNYDQLLAHNVHALSDEEEEDGWVLSCRLRPQSDLSLEFDYPIDRVARLDASRRAARVLRSERAYGGIVRVVVKTAAVHTPIAWTAGQHVLIQRARGEAAYRAFPADTAGGGFEVDLYLNVPPRTLAAAPLFAEGEALILEGPFGEFVLRPENEDLFFIAGEEGLPPAVAMLRSLSHPERDRQNTLIFDAGREAESGLRTLVGAHAVLRFGLDALTRRLDSPDAVQLYLCGPSAFNAAARSILADLGAQNVIVSEIDTI